jgi:hypothetical protein
MDTVRPAARRAPRGRVRAPRGRLCLPVLALGIASLAHAAPGDPVTLRGTLAWPQTLEAQPFAVVRLDDGRFFYADLSSVQRQGPIAAGARILLLGVEGARPHEVTGVAIGPGDSVVAAPPAAPPAEPAASPATAASPRGDVSTTATPRTRAEEGRSLEGRSESPERRSESPERIEGTLASLRNKVLTIRVGDRAVEVDVAKISASALQGVKAGDRVIVFAVSERGQTLTAVGFVHASAPAPRAR